MYKTIFSVALLGLSLTISAQDSKSIIAKGKELTVKNGCVACHQEFGPKLAPGYSGVGVKYKKSAGKNAVNKIAESIAKGSKGQYPKFKDSVMPPYAHISESDRKAIATYIVSLSK